MVDPLSMRIIGLRGSPYGEALIGFEPANPVPAPNRGVALSGVNGDSVDEVVLVEIDRDIPDEFSSSISRFWWSV